MKALFKEAQCGDRGGGPERKVRPFLSSGGSPRLRAVGLHMKWVDRRRALGDNNAHPTRTMSSVDEGRVMDGLTPSIPSYLKPQ